LAILCLRLPALLTKFANVYPSDVFFPLTAKRSGYVDGTPRLLASLTPFWLNAPISPLQSSAKLGVLYSIAHSITYMTAFLPQSCLFFADSVISQVSLSPSTFHSARPLRWSPGLLFHAPRHRAFGSAPLSNGRSRRRASSKAQGPLLCSHPLTTPAPS
jgi:hypothetical protein